MTEDEKPKKSHIGDALAHAMVPPADAPSPSTEPAPAAAAIGQDEVVEEEPRHPLSSEDPRTVESGELSLKFEQYWPMVWLAMLTVVSVIGIYNAVRHLP